MSKVTENQSNTEENKSTPTMEDVLLAPASVNTEEKQVKDEKEKQVDKEPDIKPEVSNDSIYSNTFTGDAAIEVTNDPTPIALEKSVHYSKFNPEVEQT